MEITVVKVGGSLASNPEKLSVLMKILVWALKETSAGNCSGRRRIRRCRQNC